MMDNNYNSSRSNSGNHNSNNHPLSDQQKSEFRFQQGYLPPFHHSHQLVSRPASQLQPQPSTPNPQSTTISSLHASILTSSISSSSSSPSTAITTTTSTPYLLHSHVHQNQHTQPLIGDYIVIQSTEASSLYKCVNHVTSQIHLCKIVETKNYHDYLKIYTELQDNVGINKIHEICVGSNTTLIVFEKTFGDLHSYIRTKKRLTESEARKLFHQITSIVANCHAKGIILRDIKLRKFIFRDPEQTQLILEAWDDAVILRDPKNDLLTDKHGCPTYVSPEIVSKKGTYYSGRSADCWSLGVILFTMLAGRYPFHDPNPSQLLTKIRRGAYQIPVTISPSAEFLIRSLLRREPNERLTAQDLLHSRWFSEKDAYLRPNDLLPESQLLETDLTTEQSFRNHRHHPLNYPSSLNTLNPAHPLSNDRPSPSEPKPLDKQVSTDQMVPDILSSRNPESQYWSILS